MSTARDRSLAEVAARHHGLFTIAHLRTLGFTRGQVDQRLRSGRWQQLHRGVYGIAGAPRTWEAKVLSECWGVRGLAVASHRSAAQLWALPGGRMDFVEITCRRGRRSSRGGLVVHEADSLSDDDLVRVGVIPATSVEQTLLGMAASCGPPLVELALDRALHRQLTSHGRLDEFVARKAARGRNGIGVLRRLLRQLDPLAGVPESVMETKLKQMLRSHGLPTPRFQHVIRDRRVASSRASTPPTPICGSPSSSTATSTTPVDSRSCVTPIVATCSPGSTGRRSPSPRKTSGAAAVRPWGRCTRQGPAALLAW